MMISQKKKKVPLQHPKMQFKERKPGQDAITPGRSYHVSTPAWKDGFVIHEHRYQL
jgi:hypothetical protein